MIRVIKEFLFGSWLDDVPVWEIEEHASKGNLTLGEVKYLAHHQAVVNALTGAE